MIQLAIDNKVVEVAEGTTVLQAANQAGIFIPTLCNHPMLTPSGGCRLCNVEIDGFRGPTASCTLPATQGMVVHTDTESLRASRKFILTMLFSERNHFCPFCQVSGGDCELQNAAYDQEMTHWDFQPGWLPFPLDASHPDIAIDHNRCILCRRCVRACDELAGNHTLGMAQRGTHTMLTADYGTPLGESTCISCGMCVQVCPTGALIDRHAAYMGKTAQMVQTRSICLGCSVGCGIVTYTRDNQLVGIAGDWANPVNQGLTCRFGRFEPMNDHRERLQHPMIRVNGALQQVSWEQALDSVVRFLSDSSSQTPSSVAAIASTRLSSEALVLFNHIFRAKLASKMVTGIEDGIPTATPARLADQNSQPFETVTDALEQVDCVFLAGVNPFERHGVLGMQINRRRKSGLKLIVSNALGSEFSRAADCSLSPSPANDAIIFNQIETAVRNGPLEGLPATVLNAAGILGAANKVVILYGKGITSQPSPEALTSLRRLAAALKNARLISVKGEANSLAASQLRLDVPFSVQPGQTVFAALGDDHVTTRLIDNLQNAAALIVMASYASKATEMAEVVLPAAIWSEQEGHFLNFEGRIQKAQHLQSAPADVRSNEAVLSAICDKLVHTRPQNWRLLLSERISPVALALN